MPLLHDPAVRSKIESRLRALTPDCQRQWGTMTCDQMLWHVNQVLEFSLGESSAPIRPIDGEWPVDPAFGKVKGKFASSLQAKHLDHHFKQFSS